MTRRERREAEAAGVVVPPAVAAGAEGTASSDDLDPAAAAGPAASAGAAGSFAAPPSGGSAAPTAGADAPGRADEPTFTELLGIVRPSADDPETLEDVPGDPSADAGRSDLVDPGPLASGGSWALSDDVPEDDVPRGDLHSGEPAEELRPSTAETDDDPTTEGDALAAALAALELQPEPDADADADAAASDDPPTRALDLGLDRDDQAPAGADLATSVLPVPPAGPTGLAAASAPTSPEPTAQAPTSSAGERPRSVSHGDAELPGLTVAGGAGAGPTRASSSVPPLVPRGAATGAGSTPPAGGSAAGSGGGIGSWPRSRWVLLGVGAAVVIVLALAALFVLSRSLFAGTPQPTEPPAAAAATRTVTATPAQLAPEAATGPLGTGSHPWSDLQGGECLSTFVDAWQQDYDVVDCAQPHVAQLASIGALDADPAAAYPGSDALQSQMSVLCTGADALDLAAASTYPDAQFSASWPATDAEWAAGVRSYWCFVDRAGGEPMTTSVAPAAA
nr:septum formation family protein [Frigoribacterium faeni]